MHDAGLDRFPRRAHVGVLQERAPFLRQAVQLSDPAKLGQQRVQLFEVDPFDDAFDEAVRRV